MKFERFSELWEALVTNRLGAATGAPITNGMTEQTTTALTEYAEGKKDRVEAVRKFIATTPAPAGD